MATRRNPATNEEEYYDDYAGVPDVGQAPYQPPAASSQSSPDYWIPPEADFGNNPSGAINNQNPTADPSKPFVQAGSTGGYLDGVGVTIGQGRSLTPAQAQAMYNEAIAKYGSGDVNSFMQRNPGDYNRIDEGLASNGEQGADYGSTGSGGGGSNGGSGGGGGGQSDALRQALQGLWGGQTNQNVIGSRVSNARDTLNRYQSSQLANQKAMLANRGLIGSGPEASGAANLQSRVSDMFQNAVTGIYADENENADQRMMQALGLSANLDTADQDRELAELLGMLGLDNEKELGMGQLALGNMNGVNSYNLGLANFGLDRDKYLSGADSADMQEMLQILRALQDGANTSAGGHR